MKQKYAVWGFAGAAFLVTLGITSWRDGLWSSGGPSVQNGGADASHSTNEPNPNPIPKHPFQAAMIPPAPVPLGATPAPQQQPQPSPPQQEQQQPTVGTAPRPAEDWPPAAPDPTYEQSRDDYKQRAKLMEEIAARARSQSQ